MQRIVPASITPPSTPPENDTKLNDLMNDPSRFNTNDSGEEEPATDVDYSDMYSEFGFTQSEKDTIHSAGTDYIGELEKLADLRKKGVLTDEEFEREKQEILYRANHVKTVKCEYCGSVVEVYQDKCPSCGAPIKAGKNK